MFDVTGSSARRTQYKIGIADGCIDITMLQERVLPLTLVGNTLGNARALTETQSEMIYVEHPDCYLT